MNLTEYQSPLHHHSPNTETILTNRVFSSKKSTILSPIQVAFRQLANDPLFQNASNKKNITEHSSSASWVMARTEALFNAVYASGLITEKDIEQIQSLSQEIDKIEKSLKNSPEKQLNTKCLKLAQQALGELAYFPEALRKYQEAKEIFENSLDLMVDSTYSPFYPGEALSSITAIPQAIQAIRSIESQIKSLPENSSIRLRLQENLEEHLYAFSFFLYDWQDEIHEFVEKESKDLVQSYINSSPSQKIEIVRQLTALDVQQLKLLNEIESLLKDLKLNEPTKSTSTLINSLNEVKDNILISVASLKKRSHKENIDLAIPPHKPMVFGDQEWCAFSAERQEEKKLHSNVFGNLINVLTDPENWSPRTKSIVYGLLTAMQIGHQALEFSEKLTQAQYLREQAEAASTKVSPEMERNINRDNAYLGTLLSDKYEKLLNQPELIEQFCKDNTLIREGVQEALNYFGSEAPNRTQLFHYLDAFKSKQYAKVSESPFAHLSISEWINLFTQSESEQTSQPKKPDLVITQNAKNTDTENVLLRAMAPLIGNVEAEMNNLAEAKHLLNQQMFTISESENHNLPEINQQILSMQNEIRDLENNIPSETSTLTELASWIQSAKDIGFAINSSLVGVINTAIRGFNAFHTAVQNNQPEQIILLQTMAKNEINQKNYHGVTPLQMAAKDNNFKLIKVLLEAGADINILNADWKSSFDSILRLTIKYSDLKLLKLILEKSDLKHTRDSINRPDSTGWPPLHQAAQEVKNEEFLKLLIAYGANPKLVIGGYTPSTLYQLSFPSEDHEKVFGQEDFADVALSIKKVSHSFEMSGILPLSGQSIDLEGGIGAYFARTFSDYISLFAKEFPGLKESETVFLKDILDKSIDRTDSKILLQEFQQGNSVLIHTGFKGHVVSVYMYDEYIIVGNKGALSKKPIEIYKVNKDKITKEFIEVVQTLNELGPNEYKEWIDNLPKALEGVSVPLTTSVEKAYPLKHRQIVGNCAWESTEAILFGIVALQRSLEARSIEANIPRGFQKTYIEMMEFFQLQSFEEYLKTYLCEYQQLPQLLKDKQLYLNFKHALNKKISGFSDIFTKKIHNIESLLFLVDKKFNLL